jgi:hypothetical protein
MVTTEEIIVETLDPKSALASKDALVKALIGTVQCLYSFETYTFVSSRCMVVGLHTRMVSFIIQVQLKEESINDANHFTSKFSF